ncbi:MAG: histidine kinase [Candidatus Acidiferrales bacterium]
MDRALKRDLQNYPLYFLIWTMVGVFVFGQELAEKFFFHTATPWWYYALTSLTGFYAWALLTPAVFWLGRRFPIERRHLFWRVALHILFCLILSVAQLAMESAVLPHLKVYPHFMKTFGTTFKFLFFMMFYNSILSYWAILAVQYAVGYYQDYQKRRQEALRLELRASELQSQLTQAQLGMLKMQLQPHFLFNTLNAIMVLVRQQKSKEAEETLGHLGDLLRCVLEDVQAQEVSLRRELQYLQLYLSIEQVRFQDRLRVEISTDPAILDAAVPQMVLQPVVENAIRHGIGKSSSAGRIKVSAARVNDTLELQVQDDGPGFPSEGSFEKHSSPKHGIGLANTRARLRQLHEEKARMTIENCRPHGTVVTMVLPYHAVQETFETEVMELHDSHDAHR